MTRVSWDTGKGRGKGIAFLRTLIGHQGTECVPWPLSRDYHGYGHLGFNGELLSAHRLMCELAWGAAPADGYDAAHACGKGHEGCVNPNHLSWKTHEANMADMRKHGTAIKTGPRRKLTDEQVSEIRAFKGRLTHRELGTIYGVHHRTIGLILIGQDRPNRPKRHGTRFQPAQRLEMAARAKALRAAGKSYHVIGNEIGCSRGTAKSLAGQP